MHSQNLFPPASDEDWTAGGFGIYLHWPFCQAKCPYCDFNSYVASDISQSLWRKAYLAELDRIAELTPYRVVRSIFFGGGTPSLMAPKTVEAIISKIQSLWPLANDIEITLEANPTSVEADRFRAFRDAGVNRVSLGVQALNDIDLQRLGRLHSAKDARRAVEVARAAFDRISFDLIYARQYQTPDAWAAELRQAIDMAADHLSLYQLTIEPGTAFGDRFERGRLPGLPDEDLQADMYEVTQELCAHAGLEAYEVSNHAAPGSESRHNLIYWRYGDYAGIGPGAHGRLTLDGQRYATETHLKPGDWLTAALSDKGGETRRDAITPSDQATEYLLMGLRLSEGIDLDRLATLGLRLKDSKINELLEFGLIELRDTRLIASRQGRPVLNSVLRDLLVD